MLRTLSVLVLFFAILSCNKGDDDDNNNPDGIRPEDKEKAAQLTALLQTDSFRLKKYYSETPIDYIDTDDVVKAETDLWQYVSPWLHDDAYQFGSDGSLTIHQGAVKIPSNSSATITKSYSAEADKDGVAFNFVGHEYQELQFRLVSFSDTMVKVSASWNGKTVFSEYSKLP